MGGFNAIAAGNGWLIAALGISIVFTGLTSLTIILSYIPRVLNWWGDRSTLSLGAFVKGFLPRPIRKGAVSGPNQELAEDEAVDDAESMLRLLTTRLGEPFKLPQLLDMAEKRGLEKPYSTINRLLLKGKLIGGADGLYRWAK